MGSRAALSGSRVALRSGFRAKSGSTGSTASPDLAGVQKQAPSEATRAWAEVPLTSSLENDTITALAARLVKAWPRLTAEQRSHVVAALEGLPSSRVAPASRVAQEPPGAKQ